MLNGRVQAEDIKLITYHFSFHGHKARDAAAHCLSIQCADTLDLHELLKGLRFACYVPHEKVVKTTFFYSTSPSVTYCTDKPLTTPLIGQGHRYRACTEIYMAAGV